jgi:hypothetical protein
MRFSWNPVEGSRETDTPAFAPIRKTQRTVSEMTANLPAENLKVKVKASTRIMVSTSNPRRVPDVRMAF